MRAHADGDAWPSSLALRLLERIFVLDLTGGLIVASNVPRRDGYRWRLAQRV